MEKMTIKDFLETLIYNHNITGGIFKEAECRAVIEYLDSNYISLPRPTPLEVAQSYCDVDEVIVDFMENTDNAIGLLILRKGEDYYALRMDASSYDTEYYHYIGRVKPVQKTITQWKSL